VRGGEGEHGVPDQRVGLEDGDDVVAVWDVEDLGPGLGSQ
jgi:hypothetical protein